MQGIGRSDSFLSCKRPERFAHGDGEVDAYVSADKQFLEVFPEGLIKIRPAEESADSAAPAFPYALKAFSQPLE
jgi:hypothetical protein